MFGALKALRFMLKAGVSPCSWESIVKEKALKASEKKQKHRPPTKKPSFPVSLSLKKTNKHQKSPSKSHPKLRSIQKGETVTYNELVASYKRTYKRREIDEFLGVQNAVLLKTRTRGFKLAGCLSWKPRKVLKNLQLHPW